MTLKEWYQNLKSPTPPKAEFVSRVAQRCGVSHNTVGNWVRGFNAPSNPEHLQILAEETGLSAMELYNSQEVEV